MSGQGPRPLHGDENRQDGVIATTIVVTVIAVVAVALRMLTRLWIVRSVGWDDYTIVFAIMGMIIGTALVIVQIHYGFGRHRFFITERHYIQFMKYSYGEWIQTFQTLMFTKISICFFLLRIPIEKRFIRPIQGTIVALIVSNIILTLLWVLQCRPVVKSWNKEVSGTCFTNAQLQRIIISQALVSIISDAILALFPIVLLWNVQIRPPIKVGLCILMGLGLITAAFATVRTVLNGQNVSSDPTWTSIDHWYWRSWEVCIGIVAACIPVLRPGYATVTGGIASYRAYRSSRKTSNATLVNGEEHPKTNGKKASDSQSAATHAATKEASRGQAYGAGDEDFPMHPLPGDKQRCPLGIKKTTNIDVTRSWAREKPKSLDLGDEERGAWNRDFI